MKISPSVSSGLPERTQTRNVAEPQSAPRNSSAAQPVRISRAPEEAALFAYNRQATTAQGKPPPQVDVYV